MLDSIPDGGESGHLYKFVTVLGVFLTFICIYAGAIVVSADTAIIREDGKAFVDPDLKQEVREQVGRNLSQMRKNTHLALSCLMAFAVVGLCIAMAGGFFWFIRVQRFEDRERILKNEKLERELKPTS